MSRLFPPACADRFEPIRELGAGGQGAVWLARQRRLDRNVVVKLLHPDVARRPEEVARFQAEARITALLRHPHIVVVIDHGIDDGVPWIAYEYVEGTTLRKCLESRTLPWRDACRMAYQVASALEAAHARGILHRDIKPDNVLVAAPGEYKVADFGIAKWNGSAVQTEAGFILGTPAYLSPQQLRGLAPAFESDVYALGVTLFEALTGRLPFWDENLMMLLQRRLSYPAPLASSAVDELPPALDRLVARALSAEREARFRDASEIREALGKLIGEAPAAVAPARRAGARPGDRLPVQRQFPLALAGVACAGLGLVVARVLVVAPAVPVAPASPPPPVESAVRTSPGLDVQHAPDAAELAELGRRVAVLRERMGALPEEDFMLALDAQRLPELTQEATRCLVTAVRLLRRGRNAPWNGRGWLALNECVAETCLALHKAQARPAHLPVLRRALDDLRAWAKDPGVDPFAAVVSEAAPAYALFVEAAARSQFIDGRVGLETAERKLAAIAGRDVEAHDARLRLLEDLCRIRARSVRAVAVDLTGSEGRDAAVSAAQRPVRMRQMEIARLIVELLPRTDPPWLVPVLGRVMSVARQHATMFGEEVREVRRAVGLADQACQRMRGELGHSPHLDRWVRELAALARCHGLDPPCGPARDAPAARD